MIIELAKRPAGKPHIGQNIEQLRKLLEISREELAGELVVKTLAIQRIEGKSIVGKQVLEKIASAFHALRNTHEVTAEDILNFRRTDDDSFPPGHSAAGEDIVPTGNKLA